MLKIIRTAMILYEVPFSEEGIKPSKDSNQMVITYTLYNMYNLQL